MWFACALSIAGSKSKSLSPTQLTATLSNHAILHVIGWSNRPSWNRVPISEENLQHSTYIYFYWFSIYFFQREYLELRKRQIFRNRKGHFRHCLRKRKTHFLILCVFLSQNKKAQFSQNKTLVYRVHCANKLNCS